MVKIFDETRTNDNAVYAYPTSTLLFQNLISRVGIIADSVREQYNLLRSTIGKSEDRTPITAKFDVSAGTLNIENEFSEYILIWGQPEDGFFDCDRLNTIIYNFNPPQEPKYGLEFNYPAMHGCKSCVSKRYNGKYILIEKDIDIIENINRYPINKEYEAIELPKEYTQFYIKVNGYYVIFNGTTIYNHLIISEYNSLELLSSDWEENMYIFYINNESVLDEIPAYYIQMVDNDGNYINRNLSSKGIVYRKTINRCKGFEFHSIPNNLNKNLFHIKTTDGYWLYTSEGNTFEIEYV